MLQDRSLSTQPGLIEKVLELKETHCSPYLLAFLFDCFEDALENSGQKDEDIEEQKETLRKALDVSHILKPFKSTHANTVINEYCLFPHCTIGLGTHILITYGFSFTFKFQNKCNYCDYLYGQKQGSIQTKLE